MNIEQKKLKSLLNGFRGKKILVVGDVMLDRYLRGTVSRISPEAPVPIVEMESEKYMFGGAANVALNLKSLGCDATILGVIGADEHGDRFRNLLHEKDLSADGLVVTPKRPTTVKTRIIGDNQHMVRVDREIIDYEDAQVEQELKTLAGDLISQTDGIILEDYNKGVLSRGLIEHILLLARQKKIPVTVDPKFINFNAYREVTVFKPNIIETSRALALPLDTNEQIIAAGKQLIKEMQLEHVLLTRGAAGLSIFGRDGSVHHIPAKTRMVADVSGAGDTVIAVLTAVMLAGGTVLEAATIANEAAGIVCGKVGIVPVELSELEHVLEGEA